MERVKQGLALYEQILLSKNRKITEDGGSGGVGGGGGGGGRGGIEGRGGRASKGIASSGPVAFISLTGPAGRGSTATDRQTTLHSPLRSPTYSPMPSPTHSPTHSPTYNAPHNMTSRSKEPFGNEVRPATLTSAACGVSSGCAADAKGRANALSSADNPRANALSDQRMRVESIEGDCPQSSYSLSATRYANSLIAAWELIHKPDNIRKYFLSSGAIGYYLDALGLVNDLYHDIFVSSHY